MDFYDQLSTQINRGNLYIDNEVLNLTSTGIEKIEVLENEKGTDISTTINSEEQSVPEQEIMPGIENVIAPPSQISRISPVDFSFQIADKSLKEADKIVTLQDSSVHAIDEVSPDEARVLKDVNRDISEEDRAILNLLLKNEPELAYHLALCYEKLKKALLLPSYLLQNLSLSLHVRTITGPVAQAIEPNYLKYNFVFEKSDKGHFINQMVFATILRPCFFAYDSSSSGILLNDLYAGKQGEFSEIKKLISEFMSQNSGMLSYERIRQLNGQARLNVNREKYIVKISDWLEHSQSDRYRNKAKYPTLWLSIIG
ncbi:MAG: hypothetical protein IPH20_14390 [Bacteroidales bacterium]|nr:hypothetical protein [Bacteroidales bacterium]